MELKPKDATQSNAKSAEVPQSNWYSTPGIQTYHLGRFQFLDGYLEVAAADVAEFKELVAAQPLSEQYRIQSLDGAPATVTSRSMVQGIDTTGNIAVA